MNKKLIAWILAFAIVAPVYAAAPSLDANPSGYIAQLKRDILANDPDAIGRFYDQEATGILDVVAEDTASKENLAEIRRHLAPPPPPGWAPPRTAPSFLPPPPISMPQPRKTYEITIQKQIDKFIAAPRSSDGKTRLKFTIPVIGIELVEYENGRKPDDVFFILGKTADERSIDRRRALDTLTYKRSEPIDFKIHPALGPTIDRARFEEDLKRRARAQLDAVSPISPDVLASVAYTFGINVAIWNEKGEEIIPPLDPNRNITDIAFFKDEGGRYARLVPADNAKGRIWAKVIEDGVQKSPSNIPIQYLTIEEALDSFAQSVGEATRLAKDVILSTINRLTDPSETEAAAEPQPLYHGPTGAGGAFLEQPLPPLLPPPPPLWKSPVTPTVSKDLETAIRGFIDGPRAGDAARKPADRRPRVHITTPEGIELIEYENGADGDCGLFVLGISREEAKEKLQRGQFNVAPGLIGFGLEEEVLEAAAAQLSNPDDSVGDNVLASVAYTFGKNVTIWGQNGAQLLTCHEFPGEEIVHMIFVDAVFGGHGHYARLVPVGDVRARIWAKTIENHVEQARKAKEIASDRDFDSAQENYKRAQYLDPDLAMDEFARERHPRYKKDDVLMAVNVMSEDEYRVALPPPPVSGAATFATPVPQEFEEVNAVLRAIRQEKKTYPNWDAFYQDIDRRSTHFSKDEAFLIGYHYYKDNPIFLGKDSFKALFKVADKKLEPRHFGYQTVLIDISASPAVRTVHFIKEILENYSNASSFPNTDRVGRKLLAKMTRILEKGDDFGINFKRSVSPAEFGMIWNSLKEAVKQWEDINGVYMAFGVPNLTYSRALTAEESRKLSRHKQNMFLCAALAWGENTGQDEFVTIQSVASRLGKREQEVLDQVIRIETKYPGRPLISNTKKGEIAAIILQTEEP